MRTGGSIRGVRDQGHLAAMRRDETGPPGAQDARVRVLEQETITDAIRLLMRARQALVSLSWHPGNTTSSHIRRIVEEIDDWMLRL